jgi:hypothetical protein
MPFQISVQGLSSKVVLENLCYVAATWPVEHLERVKTFK